jgi:hypothetical protein
MTREIMHNRTILNISLAAALAVAVLIVAASAAEPPAIPIKVQPKVKGQRMYFDMEHKYAYAWDALEQLTGRRPAASASRSDLAAATLEALRSLPNYGEKEVAQVRPAVPRWFTDGYSAFQPTMVAKSRYFNALGQGTFQPRADYATLFSYYSVYDAEWFALAMHPDYKAWLGAVLLTYPPAWDALSGESAEALHAQLVAPLQTPDEPYREIDNWIKRFTDDGSLIKPKVQDALVAEPLHKAGMQVDDRFLMTTGWNAAPPAGAGLDAKKWALLTALGLEFAPEIYRLDPESKQLLWVRDWLAERSYEHTAK